MDIFLWWSGLVFWGLLSLVGGVVVFDWMIDRLAISFKFYPHLVAFAAERMRKQPPQC